MAAFQAAAAFRALEVFPWRWQWQVQWTRSWRSHTPSTCTARRWSFRRAHSRPAPEPIYRHRHSSRSPSRGTPSAAALEKFVRRLGGRADRRKWCRSLHNESVWCRSATDICHRRMCWMTDEWSPYAGGTASEDALQTVTHMLFSFTIITHHHQHHRRHTAFVKWVIKYRKTGRWFTQSVIRFVVRLCFKNIVWQKLKCHKIILWHVLNEFTDCKIRVKTSGSGFLPS